MKKLESFNFLNLWIVVIFILVCIGFQTTCFNYFLPMPVKPNILFVIFIYLCITRHFGEGIFYVLLLSQVINLHSAHLLGIHLLTLLSIFLLSHAISLRFVLDGIWNGMGAIFTFTILSKILLLCYFYLFHPIESLFEYEFIYAIPIAFLNMLMTPVLFWCLNKIDLMTGKLIIHGLR